MKKVFFSNSGAEANECAIKAARKYAAEKHGPDCYTVVIQGEEKHLFFEKTGNLFTARTGRWYVEKPLAG